MNTRFEQLKLGLPLRLVADSHSKALWSEHLVWSLQAVQQQAELHGEPGPGGGDQRRGQLRDQLPLPHHPPLAAHVPQTQATIVTSISEININLYSVPASSSWPRRRARRRARSPRSPPAPTLRWGCAASGPGGRCGRPAAAARPRAPALPTLPEVRGRCCRGGTVVCVYAASSIVTITQPYPPTVNYIRMSKERGSIQGPANYKVLISIQLLSIIGCFKFRFFKSRKFISSMIFSGTLNLLWMTSMLNVDDRDRDGDTE